MIICERSAPPDDHLQPRKEHEKCFFETLHNKIQWVLSFKRTNFNENYWSNFVTYPYGQLWLQNIWIFLRLPLTVLCYHISNCSTKHEKALNVSNQKLYLLIWHQLYRYNPVLGDKGLYPEVSGHSQKGYIGDWIHPEYSLTQACFSVLNLQDSW